MPELPDVVVYLEALEERVLDQPLNRIDVRGVAVLKTFDPPVGAAEGERVIAVSRLGKRLVFELSDDLFLVIHLMVAGRLKWHPEGAKVPGKVGLAGFHFTDGSLILTEAAKKKRAAIWLHRGREEMLDEHDRQGTEPLEVDRDPFVAKLTETNRTLKRALTDPRVFSGIGNAYSDEILLHARLSPVRRTHQLEADELTRLYDSTVSTLNLWLDRLRDERGDRWPTKVTAFRDEMVVHGKFREPCAVCGSEVQRIRYASNEVNYCPTCQTNGKVLADRSLSRLLKDDWPKTIEDLEELRPS